jgi:hypothetical protein
MVACIPLITSRTPPSKASTAQLLALFTSSGSVVRLIGVGSGRELRRSHKSGKRIRPADNLQRKPPDDEASGCTAVILNPAAAAVVSRLVNVFIVAPESLPTLVDGSLRTMNKEAER